MNPKAKWVSVLLVTMLLAPGPNAPAQSYTYTTLAGKISPNTYLLAKFDGLASTAYLGISAGLAVDRLGNIFVADSNSKRIRLLAKVGTNYVVGTVAGNFGISGAPDGPGVGAGFSDPFAVVEDASNNLYVADLYTIRKVDATGYVTTIAGLYNTHGTNDGVGSAARFNVAEGIALDAANNLYVADTGNHTIRKISPGGMVTTLAGLGGTSGTNDGTGSAARFYDPMGIAVDAPGNIVVADNANDTIRLITPGGVVSTLAGQPGVTGTNDGTGGGALFNEPIGVAYDSAGNIDVADFGNNAVRQIAPGGVVTTFARTPAHSLALDGAGNIYVSRNAGDQGGISQISPAGVVTTLFAPQTGGVGHSDGVGGAASFDGPNSVALDSSGNVYVADELNNTIRKITPNGAVTTPAGLAGTSGSKDGTGSAARFNRPEGVAVDNAGNVYVADQSNDAIRKVTPGGVVTTLAGKANFPGSIDGTNSIARFNQPSDVAVDGSGNLYVTDFGNNTVRKLSLSDATGTNWAVTTLAGMAGASGTNDGTGNAARFYEPFDLTVDSSGTLFVSDTGNQTIRKVTAAGVVTTLAGAAGMTGTNDGTGSAARFNFPNGIAADGSGNLFVADADNNLIRKVTSAGVVTTVGGSALPFATGYADGTGTNAYFFTPYGVAVDTAGNLYVADYGNNLIRKGTPTSSLAFVTLQPPASGSGNFGFWVAGPANLLVSVDSSTNLVNWQSASTLTLVDGSNYFLGPLQRPAYQFFRVRVP